MLYAQHNKQYGNVQGLRKMSLEPFQILFATVFRFISLMIVLRTSDIQ